MSVTLWEKLLFRSVFVKKVTFIRNPVVSQGCHTFLGSRAPVHVVICDDNFTVTNTKQCAESSFQFVDEIFLNVLGTYSFVLLTNLRAAYSVCKLRRAG